MSLRVASAALLVAAACGYAQDNRATLLGVITDQTGAVVAGAQVLVVNTATGVRSATESNGEGNYLVPYLAPGAYRLRVECAGFKAFERSPIELRMGDRTRLDVQLTVGEVSDAVNVAAENTPLVNLADSTISHVIDRTQIDQLPRSSRSVRSLLVTIPGSETNGYRSWGQRWGSTDFQLDGTPLVSRSRGAVPYREPGLDSIQEVSVDNNNVSAKYNTPAVVIASTKSGTNELHGALFETHVNSRVGGARTRDASNALAPYSNRGQYGGSAGGPVVLPRIYSGRNRTFWFFAYEGQKQVSNSLVNYSVPTAAMRAGDFSGLLDANGRLTSIYDPWTTDPKTYQRQPFRYGGKLNAIDPARMSPLWKQLMDLTPLPTLPGVNPLIASNWFGNARTTQDDSTLTARIDHRFSDRDTIYGRYSRNPWVQDNPYTNTAAVPLLQNVANRNPYSSPSQSLVLSWVRIVSPTLFNEVLATVYRQAFFQGMDANGQTDWAGRLGLPNPLGVKQWPDIMSLGLNGIAYRVPYPNADHSTFYQIDDNLTKVVGRHQFTMGVHLRRDLFNYMPAQQEAAGLTQPVANWTALWDPTGTATTPRTTPLTGSALASSYLGQMMYEMKTTQGYLYMRQNQYAAYFQDSFKVTRRFTLNLGLRWQAWPAMQEKYGILGGFKMAQKALVLTQPLEGYSKLSPLMAQSITRLQSLGVKFIDYQQAGVPRNLVFSNWKDFAPRLGFAYRASGGNRPLVVRGGYSLAYFPVPMASLTERMRGGIPFVATPTYTPDSSGYYPDGLPGWSLRSIPTYVAGANTRNILDNPGGSLGLTAGSLTGYFFDPNWPDARVHDWNLTLEKEVLPRTLARVGWVGNHGTELDVFRSVNAQIPQFVWASNVGLPYPTSAGGSRPYDATYGNVLEFGKWGYSNYTGMQFELARRYSNGFGYQVFYVVSNAAALGALNDYSTLTTTYTAPYYLNSQAAGLSQKQLDRLLWYRRDNSIPKQRLSWNWVADVPFGKGKLLGRNMHGVLDAVAGGWQISGYGNWNTSWFALPSDQFPSGSPFEVYGRKYPIQDCRSGRCLSGFLYFNGYINPAQINSVDAKGKPNGIMGVPSNYKPAFQNLIPFPASPVPGDPNAPYYGTNTVWIPQKDGTVWRGNWAGIPPLQNQYVQGPGLWTLSAALFKSFPMGDRMRLRVQWDVFNPTNSPQQPTGINSQGIQYTYTSGTAARSMQFTARLLW